MNLRVLVASLTLMGFAAGFATRAWTEMARSVPAPTKLGGEFAPVPKSTATDAKKPVNREDLIAEIERNRAQSEAYRAKVAAFDGEFETGFSSLLKGDQCAIYTARQKQHAEQAMERVAKAPATLSDDDIDRLRRSPLYGILNVLAVSNSVDGLTKYYKLDGEQQARTRELLTVRRNKLVALIEATPPPSVRLSSLVPVVQKVAAPKSAP